MVLDARLPDTAILESCLRAVLRDVVPGAGELVGIERRPNVYTSSAPSEIVTCRFTSGKELQLLLKEVSDSSVAG